MGTDYNFNLAAGFEVSYEDVLGVVKQKLGTWKGSVEKLDSSEVLEKVAKDLDASHSVVLSTDSSWSYGNENVFIVFGLSKKSWQEVAADKNRRAESGRVTLSGVASIEKLAANTHLFEALRLRMVNYGFTPGEAIVRVCGSAF